MRTAQWKTADCPGGYEGPGRIAISPAPEGTRRGYRLSPVLFVDKPLPAAMVDLAFRMADPGAVWRQLHALVYPWEPILCGTASREVGGYRREFAQWLSFFTGEQIEELDPETYRPVKVRPVLYGLTGPALKSAPLV